MPVNAKIATLADVTTENGIAVSAELSVESVEVTAVVTADAVTLMTDPVETCSRTVEVAAAVAVVVTGASAEVEVEAAIAETEVIVIDGSASAVLRPHAARSLLPT